MKKFLILFIILGLIFPLFKILGATSYTQTCGSCPAGNCAAEDPCDIAADCRTCPAPTCPAARANSSLSSNTCGCTMATGCTCKDLGEGPICGGTPETCSFSSGTCIYTCTSGWETCDENDIGADGCECNVGEGYECIDGSCEEIPPPPPTEIYELVQNPEYPERQFYIQKTLTYGEAIIIWFLTIFLIIVITKLVFNFFWK